MRDLERLFRQLVRSIADRDPADLHRPLRLQEIVESFLPYRVARRALGVDAHEDYELLLLRLAAGEGGLVATSPEEARREFAAEAASPNPDLGVLGRRADAELALQGEPLAYALGPDPDHAYAPAEPLARDEPDYPPIDAAGDLDDEAALDPDPAAVHVRPSDAAAEALTDDALLLDAIRRVPSLPSLDAATRCGYCGGALPTGRVVNFCPFCGQNQSPAHCPECHGEVEPGWRHCVSCGHPLGSPPPR